MRRAFVEALTAVADLDDRIVLLTGDLGFSYLEAFAERHPSRFVNCGVAEQNMVAVATALAMEGLLPWCYSIGNFMALRPLEFIRNGPLYHNLPVRFVGTGRDREYLHEGFTHWMTDDRRVLRSIGLDVREPETNREVGRIVRDEWEAPHPFYLSLSKVEVP